MRIMKFSMSVAVGLCLLSGSAFALPVTVLQDYSIGGSPNSRDDLLNTLITATFMFDDGSLIGSGQEFIPAVVDGVYSKFGWRDDGGSREPVG